MTLTLTPEQERKIKTLAAQKQAIQKEKNKPTRELIAQ